MRVLRGLDVCLRCGVLAACVVGAKKPERAERDVGAGHTVTTTWINLFCYWLFQIPLAWALATGFGLGPAGVYWAITIAKTVIAVVAIAYFRRGHRKTRTV